MNRLGPVMALGAGACACAFAIGVASCSDDELATEAHVGDASLIEASHADVATGFVDANSARVDSASPSKPTCATACSPEATCNDSTETPVCTCKPGFVGDGGSCVAQPAACAASPCLNGGSCAEADGGFTCACKPGFTGATCATNVDDCNPNPCLNGGTCTDGVSSFTCACKPGFTGATCQNDHRCDPPNAANLIANPSFDSNVASWTPFSASLATSLSPLDAFGCPTSGSIEVKNVNPAGINSVVYQCVPVTAGTAYDFGALINVPAAPTGQASLSIDFRGGAGCTAPALGFHMYDANPALTGQWQPIGVVLVAPDGAVSAQVELRMVQGTGSGFNPLYDHVYLSPAPATF